MASSSASPQSTQPHTIHSSRQATAGIGSRTQTQTQASPTTRQPVLRLRGAVRTKSDRKIQWAADVVDNEGLGRKSSKVCCIYHKPKPVEESSDESSSDSDSDSDTNDDRARPAGGRRENKDHSHRHDHNGEGCSHDHGKEKLRRGSPNAYEKMPKVKDGGGRSK